MTAPHPTPQDELRAMRFLKTECDFSTEEGAAKCLALEFALVRSEEREACAKIAEGKMPVGPDPIGALHGAGWAGAVKCIASAIRVEK